MNQNVTKVQQIQNSLTHPGLPTAPYGQEKNEKSSKVDARTSTIVRAGPTINGSIPIMNEDFMDNEMLFASWEQSLVNEGSVSSPYFEMFVNTLIDTFMKKFPAAADVLKASGNESFRQKNYAEAVKQYTLAIELSQKNPGQLYHVKRANAYFEMGLFEECVADCLRALELDPLRFKNCGVSTVQSEMTLQKLAMAMETLREGNVSSPVVREDNWFVCQDHFSIEINRMLKAVVS